MRIVVPEGTTVRDVIHRPGPLRQFPGIDLGASKVGIVGHGGKLDAPGKEHDRVETCRLIHSQPRCWK